MIEINLLPDIKQELIKAQRARTMVISGSVVVGIAAIALVVLLAFYAFAAQTLLNKNLDDTITTEQAKIAKVPGLSDSLTIQNQLTKLSEMHDAKHLSSRVILLLSKEIIPPSPNEISVTTFELDTATETITMEAQAPNGYPSLEVFKKTLGATKLNYVADECKETNKDYCSVPLATNVSDSDRSYGEDASGKRVLRFKISFTYPAALFSRQSQLDTPHNPRLGIVGPNLTVVTDSFLGIPQDLFSNRSKDIVEGAN